MRILQTILDRIEHLKLFLAIIIYGETEYRKYHWYQKL
jgi:hypothetical protein